MKFFNRNGLSFVEVIVATLLMGLITAAFYGLHVFSKNTLSLAHHKILALYWAQALLEADIAKATANDPNENTFLPDGKGANRNIVRDVLPVYTNDNALERLRTTVAWTE